MHGVGTSGPLDALGAYTGQCGVGQFNEVEEVGDWYGLVNLAAVVRLQCCRSSVRVANNVLADMECHRKFRTYACLGAQEGRRRQHR